MLVLAVHSFEQVTAKVPFAIILLQDLITNKKAPPELKCRQMTPTSGSRSTSLWDVQDPEHLLQWLNENVNVDCTHEIFEVQEEFSVGVMGEVGRARAAERVAAGARDIGERTASTVGRAATVVSTQAHDLDTKLKISERASATATAVRESSVVRSAGEFLGRAGSAVKQATTKVVENERVASATHAIGSSFKKLGKSLSNKGRMNSSEDDGELLGGEEQAHQYARQPMPEYEPPPPQNGSLRNPAPTAPPSPSPAASPPPHKPSAQLVEDTPTSPPPETVAFTLDDSETGPTPGKP